MALAWNISRQRHTKSLRTGLHVASVVALAATLRLPFLHSPLWVRHRSARGGLAMLFNTISYAFFLIRSERLETIHGDSLPAQLSASGAGIITISSNLAMSIPLGLKLPALIACIAVLGANQLHSGVWKVQWPSQGPWRAGQVRRPFQRGGGRHSHGADSPPPPITPQDSAFASVAIVTGVRGPPAELAARPPLALHVPAPAGQRASGGPARLGAPTPPGLVVAPPLLDPGGGHSVPADGMQPACGGLLFHLAGCRPGAGMPGHHFLRSQCVCRRGMLPPPSIPTVLLQTIPLISHPSLP
ncbi:hypothetical protein ACKKBG_A03935 [Auxenochlorella protothecoides x Auxenochlorella symbiontica]